MKKASFGLFQAYGVELEYMIVNQKTLQIESIADQLLRSPRGKQLAEFEHNEITWSNELASHLIELKITDPAESLENLAPYFQKEIQLVNEKLAGFHAKLMPTGMHPWMDPQKELQLWPHKYHEIYDTYNKIFDCHAHGWANLQSIHLNLPFIDDAEFAQLHAAIRFLLPILPALAASSPIMNGKATGILDNRMQVYLHNAESIPSIAGKVIPEAIQTKKEYREKILKKIYQDLAPYDPDKILRHEWCNSRGAIPRFDRNTIEIRVLDIQECPEADLAISQAIVEVLKSLIDEKWTPFHEIQGFPLENLYAIFLKCIQDAESAHITDTEYLKLFGYPDTKCHAEDLWAWLLEPIMPLHAALRNIISHGTLAQRILKALNKEGMESVYERLCACLQEGTLFK